MNYKIETIEGIGKVMGDKLRASGVADTSALLAKTSKPKDREALAAKTGISGKLILKFANRADLMRVNGVGEEYADLLEAAGVDTVPELAQRKAQNLFDALTNDPALHFSMRLDEGDMQFVHNHTMLHDRTAFEDWSDPAQRRYLLRLWLAVPGARALPPVFAQRYGSLTVGDRGGIVVPGMQPTVEMA